VPLMASVYTATVASLCFSVSSAGILSMAQWGTAQRAELSELPTRCCPGVHIPPKRSGLSLCNTKEGMWHEKTLT
jgi:hypothetical protein